MGGAERGGGGGMLSICIVTETLSWSHECFCPPPPPQLQGDIGNRAPAYLRDLIGKLTTFSDEPRLAGLVGLVVTMVMDLAYTSSRQPSGVKGKSAGSSSCQVKPLMSNKHGSHIKHMRTSL